jgi:hypothetical protein
VAATSARSAKERHHGRAGPEPPGKCEEGCMREG